MPDTRYNPSSPTGHLEASLPLLPGNTFNVDKVIKKSLDRKKRKNFSFKYFLWGILNLYLQCNLHS